MAYTLSGASENGEKIAQFWEVAGGRHDDSFRRKVMNNSAASEMNAHVTHTCGLFWSTWPLAVRQLMSFPILFNQIMRPMMANLVVKQVSERENMCDILHTLPSNITNARNVSIKAGMTFHYRCKMR